jgi:hypothetical protein
MENLIGRMVNVVVGKDGKVASKILKVCKVKVRSVLFIEVDKVNRKNIFRKVSREDIAFVGMVESKLVNPELMSIYLKENILPTKWESDWDSIGQPSQMSLNQRITPHFSNHSKGWAPKLPSTTNSAAGFPMV